MLVLDGVVQLTERDEFLYHESLVHPALHVHPAPKEVLIIGGGDGGSLREALKHKDVKRVLLVEIDRRVIEASKKFFPTLAEGYQDSRVQVRHLDGAKLLERPPRRFDVIIVDSTDPVGAAEKLFQTPFFQAAANALTADGMFVAQSESLLFHQDLVANVQKDLSKVFPIVDCYTQPIATYAGNWWTFSIASKRYNPRRPNKPLIVPTRLYSLDMHRKAFLPRSVYRRLLAGTLDWG